MAPMDGAVTKVWKPGVKKAMSVTLMLSRPTEKPIHGPNRMPVIAVRKAVGLMLGKAASSILDETVAAVNDEIKPTVSVLEVPRLALRILEPSKHG